MPPVCGLRSTGENIVPNARRRQTEAGDSPIARSGNDRITLVGDYRGTLIVRRPKRRASTDQAPGPTSATAAAPITWLASSQAEQVPPWAITMTSMSTHAAAAARVIRPRARNGIVSAAAIHSHGPTLVKKGANPTFVAIAAARNNPSAKPALPAG